MQYMILERRLRHDPLANVKGNIRGMYSEDYQF